MWAVFDKGDAAHYVHSVPLMPVGGSGDAFFYPVLHILGTAPP
jgi:hypothetical protein